MNIRLLVVGFALLSARPSAGIMTSQEDINKALRCVQCENELLRYKNENEALKKEIAALKAAKADLERQLAQKA